MVFDLASNLVLSSTDDYALHSQPLHGEKHRGQFLIAVDFGKHADHSAIAVLEKVKELRLVNLREFPLETPYTAA
jgi:phage FluMu gp28-like protein